MDSRDMNSQNPDAIRNDIEGTRAALSSKLHQLESEVRETAQDAREAVEERIDHLKETVSLTHQVNERPWTFFAGSLVIGAVAGHLLTRAALHEETGPTVAASLAPVFRSELQMLKGAAFSMVLTMLRDVTRETVKPALSDIVQNALEGMLGSHATATAGANGR